MNSTSIEAMPSGHEAALLRTLCIDQLSNHGPMTADEIATRLGRSPLAIRPRISELKKRNTIVDTGTRRANRSGKSAKVWSIAA